MALQGDAGRAVTHVGKPSNSIDFYAHPVTGLAALPGVWNSELLGNALAILRPRPNRSCPVRRRLGCPLKVVAGIPRAAADG